MAFSFWNWRGTPNDCSRSRNRAKNAAFSISCYRTALGRMAKWSRPSANPLTYLRKPPPPPPALRRTRRPNRRKMRFGWGTWIRTKINGVRVLNPWFQHPSERFAVLKSLKYMMLEKRPRETRRPYAADFCSAARAGSALARWDVDLRGTGPCELVLGIPY